MIQKYASHFFYRIFPFFAFHCKIGLDSRFNFENLFFFLKKKIQKDLLKILLTQTQHTLVVFVRSAFTLYNKYYCFSLLFLVLYSTLLSTSCLLFVIINSFVDVLRTTLSECYWIQMYWWPFVFFEVCTYQLFSEKKKQNAYWSWFRFCLDIQSRISFPSTSTSCYLKC